MQINIKVEFGLHYKIPPHNGPIKVAWDKATDEDINLKYTAELDKVIAKDAILSDIDKLSSKHDCKLEDIDIAIETLTSSMLTVGLNLPTRQFKRHLKPYWCPELTSISKSEKEARAKWVEANKPRDPNNVLYKHYKSLKREFQKKRRQSKAKFELQQHMEIAEQEEISQKYFWFLVNKSRKPKQSSSITPITFPNGTTACDPESLAEEWRHYF